MLIEVLYFKDCPNHPATTQRVREAIKQAGVHADVWERELAPEDDAAKLKFLGSPTVLVDGVDVEPAARCRTDFGFSCRKYFGGAGVPPVEMIVAAIREHRSTAQVNVGESAKTKAETQVAFVRKRGTIAMLGAVIAAIVSSACCWLPLLLLAFGLSAAGVGALFEKVRPVSLSAATVLLGIGFYLAYFRRRVCTPAEACATPNPKLQHLNRMMLWVAVVFVAAFALFPYYGVGLVRARAKSPMGAPGSGSAVRMVKTAEQTTRVFQIEGMTCSICAAGLEVQLDKLPGVIKAAVSFETGAATIRSVPGEPSDERVRTTVERAGFKVADQAKHP